MLVVLVALVSVAPVTAVVGALCAVTHPAACCCGDPASCPCAHTHHGTSSPRPEPASTDPAGAARDALLLAPPAMPGGGSAIADDAREMLVASDAALPLPALVSSLALRC